MAELVPDTTLPGGAVRSQCSKKQVDVPSLVCFLAFHDLLIVTAIVSPWVVAFPVGR